MESMPLSPDFWKGKRVLVTGHTGFKGSWLCLLLHRLGSQASGLSLNPPSTPNLFELAGVRTTLNSHHIVNVNDPEMVKRVFCNIEPDVVIHLAAQSLVRRSYASPVETFETNVLGTVHVLEALRISQPEVGLFATTDKVYSQLGTGQPFRETDPLGGDDPYSASKAASEIAIESFRKSFSFESPTRLATARAGNVIGGGDWAEDRLLPDAVRAWSSGQVLTVRNPDSVRPWQHVLDCLVGYLELVQGLLRKTAEPGAFNFGPRREVRTVRQTVELAQRVWGDAAWVDWRSRHEGPREAKTLLLNTDKVAEVLRIEPRWSQEDSVRRTILWYRGFYDGIDPRDLCERDFVEFGLP